MAQLRADYDRQLAELAKNQSQAAANSISSSSIPSVPPNDEAEQQRRLAMAEQTRAVQSKVAALRGDLIGGERANDVQLREKHKKKKAAAARRLR